jgi:signal peptidase II
MIPLFLIAAAVVFVDQLSKYLIIVYLPLYGGLEVSPIRITVIPGFLDIIHSQNRAGAFGLFAGGPPVFLIIGAVAVLFLLFFYWRNKEKDAWIRLALGLILGGAVGNNIVDRIVRGGVIDWIEMYIGKYHWPTYNLADSAIVVGAIIILWRGLFTGNKKKPEEAKSDAQAETPPTPPQQ